MLPMGFDGSLEEYRSIMSSEIYNPLDKTIQGGIQSE